MVYAKYLENVIEIFTTEFSTYLYIVCKNSWKFNLKIVFYYVFSITRSKTQVSVTTQTHARSQLSPMKQCDYLSIALTFFLTKNFNYNKIFDFKHHFVCSCFANATIASMLTSVNSWTVRKKAHFWKR